MNNHETENDSQRRQETQQYWDRFAQTFDDAPDHGLRDPLVREAWTQLLQGAFPRPNAAILDIGCGTGSLSIILAGLGHDVTGIDLSPAMIAAAEAKAAGHGLSIKFYVMDAAFPQLPPRQFDGLVCRHLLWALPEPQKVLHRWSELLKPEGRVVLIEGFWDTGGGLHASEITAVLPSSLAPISVQNLSANPNLWGRPVTDERYMIVADYGRPVKTDGAS